MTGRGSPTAPKEVDVGMAAAVEGVGKTITDHNPIEAAHRKAEDIRLKQLIHEQLSRFFTTHETPMPPAAAGEEDAIPGGSDSHAGGMGQNWYQELESPEFCELLELYKDRVYDANIASAAKTTARQRFGGALRRNDCDRERGGGSRKNFKTTRRVREAVAPRATFAKEATKDSGRSKAKAATRARYSREARYEVSGYDTLPSWHRLRAARDSANTNRREPPSAPAAAYGAFRRVLRTTKTPTYFIADAATKAPWSEIMRGSIETLYGTDDSGAKVLDLRTASLTGSTYSNYGGKIRLFAEFCIDEEGISPMDCTEVTCVRYLTWIAERGTIGADSLQPYLSAINTFLRHTGRDDAPATVLAISDMKRALQIRQVKTSEELRRAPLPCDVITNIFDDLANLPMTTAGYGTILREGAAVCSTFMFYSRGESSVSCQLRDMHGRGPP
eukprot:jgi/Tetstr1/462002/TSEL_007073.t1